MEGTIKRLVTDRGFGFIKTDIGDVFFHRSGIKRPDKFEDLQEGDNVEFECAKVEKGLRAESIVRL